jgi:hypothetical protein
MEQMELFAITAQKRVIQKRISPRGMLLIDSGGQYKLGNNRYY